MERKSFFYAMAENGGDGGMIPDVKVTKNQKVRRLSSGFSKYFSNLWLAYTVKRPIFKSSLMRQIAPLEYINTLLKRAVSKKPR